MYEYRIQTIIPRNFDPEVEGITLDSIVETCDGVVNYAIPYSRKNTVIVIQSEDTIDLEYLREQLNDEFGHEGEVITSITRKPL